MSVEKSELRASMAHDLGLRLDDALEAAEREATRLEGAVEWLMRAGPMVGGAHAAIEGEVESGKMDLEAAQAAKAIISKLGSQLSDLVKQATADMQATRGKAVAYRASVALTKQAFDTEKAKAKAAALAAAATDLADAALAVDVETAGARPVGARPPPPIKARRKVAKRARNT